MNHNLSCRIRHRTTEIVVRRDFDFGRLTEEKRLFASILFRSANSDFEFRQLVLFQAEKDRPPNLASFVCSEEDRLEHAQGQIALEIERAPGAAKVIQSEFLFGDFRAAR